MRSTATLKGFFRGLGVVKGEGVAAAKKALPCPLKNKFKNLNFYHISKNLNLQKIKINSKFKFSKKYKIFIIEFKELKIKI